jgi:lysophospholipase L1-like esterase
MRSSRFWLWRVPVAFALAGALVLGAGFYLALRGSVGEPIGLPPPTPGAGGKIARRSGELVLLALGDSLTRGTGDLSGKGYAVELLERLKRRGPARLINLAVPGSESEDVRRLVESPNVRSLAAAADLVILSVGGNDLSGSLPRGAEAAEAIREVERARSRFAANLRATLARLREANPRSPIYLLGLYDPFGAGPRPRPGTSVLLGWNSLVQQTALSFPGVWVVPIFDLFEDRHDRLAADEFHPNREGYHLIAERVVQLLPPGL